MKRSIPVWLVSLAAVALATAGCVAADSETASLESGGDSSQTLPSVTQAPTDDAAGSDSEPDVGSDSEPDVGSDSADGSSSADSTTSTETSEALPELQGLDVELVASGFDQPVLVAAVPGTGALLVVEREGVIRVVEDGAVAEEPFIDLTDQLLSASIEQGLLGLAFHPDFVENGTVFAYWTDTTGDSRLARFQTSSPTLADPETIEVVLEVDQPAERHNAGMIEFGPDGLLYLALGDGGSGGATSQDTTNLLGTILRIDVDVEPDAGQPYTIPAGNPFDDEIWVYGLRNPWRFSIDEASETVYIGDVGQERWEEVNVVGLDGAGTNFGWFRTEGTDCFREGCDRSGLTDPILQYSHDEGCSITGGLVYRGVAIPELIGHYFFADWCGGLVRSFRLTAQGQVADQLDWSDDLGALGQVTSFATDSRDELLATNWAGELYRVVPRR